MGEDGDESDEGEEVPLSDNTTPATTLFYVWLTTFDTSYVDQLCLKLIKRGFVVGAMGRKLFTEHEDNAVSVVALSIHRHPVSEEEKRDYTATGIHAEITDVLRTLKAKWASMVVSVTAGCTWNIGNVRVTAAERAVELTKKLN